MTFSDLATAIAHETRQAIMATLDEHEAVGMGALAQELDIAPATLTHHVSILERAGLVARIASGREVLVEARGSVEIVVYPQAFENIRDTAHRP